MNHKSNIVTVVEVAPDYIYYPTEILHHKAIIYIITIRHSDTSVQQCQRLIFENNETHAVCKDDDIVRNIKKIQIPQPNMQDVIDTCNNKANNTDFEIESTNEHIIFVVLRNIGKLFILIVLKMKLLSIIVIFMILNTLR